MRTFIKVETATRLSVQQEHDVLSHVRELVPYGFITANYQGCFYVIDVLHAELVDDAEIVANLAMQMGFPASGVTVMGLHPSDQSDWMSESTFALASVEAAPVIELF